MSGEYSIEPLYGVGGVDPVCWRQLPETDSTLEPEKQAVVIYLVGGSLEELLRGQSLMSPKTLIDQLLQALLP